MVSLFSQSQKRLESFAVPHLLNQIKASVNKVKAYLALKLYYPTSGLQHYFEICLCFSKAAHYRMHSTLLQTLPRNSCFSFQPMSPDNTLRFPLLYIRKRECVPLSNFLFCSQREESRPSPSNSKPREPK